MTGHPDNETRIYPFSGICANCLRDRDDLFQHPDGNRYCANVWACEWRYYVQGERPGKYLCGAVGAVGGGEGEA